MYKKIVGYKVISIPNLHVADFQKFVNDQIAQGWRPKGSLVIDSNGSLYQVMVKTEE
jgi:hypothetical protein